MDECKIQSLIEEKEEFIGIRKSKIEGVMSRSRCRYQGLGEKRTNYFFSLEHRNFTSKVMNKLIVDGIEYTETKDI